MYYRALALATSLFLCACSDPPSITIDCSKGTLETDETTIVCVGGDGDGNGNSNGADGDDDAPSIKPQCTRLKWTPPGPWIAHTSGAIHFPKVCVEQDARVWTFSFQPPLGATLEAVEVYVEPTDDHDPVTRPVVTLSRYDGADGFAEVESPTEDTIAPSGYAELHPIRIEVPKESARADGMDYRIDLQAPAGTPGSCLWINSAPILTLAVCP